MKPQPYKSIQHIVLLLVLLFPFCPVGMKGKSVVWKKPGCLHMTDPVFEVRQVTFSDTATTVQLAAIAPTYNVKFISSTHLLGEGGKTYAVKYCKEYPLDVFIPTKNKLETVITLVFQPMPKKTKVIDLIEGYGPRNFKFWGIHSAKCPLKVQPYVADPQQLDAFRHAFFTPGEVQVSGRFEKLPDEAFRLGNVNVNDMLTGKSSNVLIAVQDDGTFAFRFHADCPGYYLGRFGNRFVPFFAIPGQKLNLVVHDDDSVDSTDPNGAPVFGANYSRSQLPDVLLYSQRALMDDAAMKPFHEIAQKIDTVAGQGIMLCDYLASRYAFTAPEYFLARNNMLVTLAYRLLDVRMNMVDTEHSAQTKAEVNDMANYAVLRRLPTTDPLLLMTANFAALQNYYSIGDDMQKALGKAEGETVNGMTVLKPYAQEVTGSLRMEADHRMFNTRTNSVFFKVMMMNNLASSLSNVVYPDLKMPADARLKMQQQQDANMRKQVDRVQALVPDSFFRKKAESLYQDYLMKKDYAYSLPQGKATQTLMNRLKDVKGKYVILDFWNASCGPCRAEIERSVAMREALKGRPDVAFVYITSDKETSEAFYNDYAGRYLSSSYSYRVPHSEYVLYTELFSFNAIPHTELLAPDGRVLRENLTYLFYNDANDFDALLKSIKDKVE